MNFTLLSNYVRAAVRNIFKNKTFSAINIFGLAISMSVGLLIITFVNELNSYDNFQVKADRIYRLTNLYKYLDEDESTFASTSVLAGKRVQEEVPGLEEVVLIRRNFSNDFGTDDRKIPLEGYYASEGFFNVFSFKLIDGDPETALKEPYTMVITIKAAEKLYGGADEAMGKVLLTADDKQYTITGVMENPPFNSHMEFEVLGSFATHDEESKDGDRYLKWTNMWMYHVYILLEEGKTEKDILPALALISDEENAKEEHTKVNLGLQNISAITPGPDMSNQIGKTTPSFIPVMLAIFALIVIISACFNYTNLSIARSLRRAKEVGVRKVIGSSSGQVFFQFIMESIIIALMALVFAIGLFFIIRPAFLQLDEEFMDRVKLFLDTKVIIQFVIMAVITGALAGLLPAFIFARISPNNVLRNTISLSNVKGFGLRKVLIVIQFTLSIMFILGAIIEYKQFRYAMNFDLGYETENVLNVELQGNKPGIIKNEFSKLPEVANVSASLMITSVGSYWGETLKYKDPLDSISVYYNGIDENYLPLHNHKLIAGTNFAPVSNDSATIQIIVNEKLLNRFNIGTPEEALGEMLKMDDKEARIVGVLKDFHYGKLNHEMKPFLFKYETEDFYQVNVKFKPNTDLLVARGKIEKAWQEIDTVHKLEATFYDDRIEDAYMQFAVMVKVVGVLAFLAIVIAVLGLLGMVLFTTETKLKEISIRKVLGASESSLIYLLGKGFFILLLTSSIIAVPATILFFTEIVLSGDVYRANISVTETLFGPIFVLSVGMLTTIIITFFAARSNPATILRNE